MAPRRAGDEWTDLAIDRAFEDVQRQVNDLKDTLHALAAVPTETARAATRLEAVADELEDFKSWITDVEARLTGRIDRLRDDVDTELTTRRRNRVTVSVAVIAGCFTVLAAIIAAGATIIGGP